MTSNRFLVFRNLTKPLFPVYSLSSYLPASRLRRPLHLPELAAGTRFRYCTSFNNRKIRIGDPSPLLATSSQRPELDFEVWPRTIIKLVSKSFRSPLTTRRHGPSIHPIAIGDHEREREECTLNWVQPSTDGGAERQTDASDGHQLAAADAEGTNNNAPDGRAAFSGALAYNDWLKTEYFP